MSPEEFTNHRKLLGLSQDRAASIFGVHRVTWVRWETGVRDIPPTAKILMTVLLKIPEARTMLGMQKPR